MTTELALFQARCRERVNRRLEQASAAVAAAPPPDDTCPALARGLSYALADSGKRVRPTLVYAAAEAVGPAPDDALDTLAAAVEMIHTYSLIHDDLPAMDDDDLRRGRPTLHRVCGEAAAILVGDGLQPLAAELVLDEAGLDDRQRVACVRALAKAAGFAGMVGGQGRDMAATGQGAALGLEGLRRMHEQKTGALIRCALRLGAVAAHASERQLEALDHYGHAIGLAFQVVDDVLDVTADSAILGKTGGKDAACGKATYVSLLGLDGARATARQLLGTAEAALDAEPALAGQRLRALARYIVERAH